MRFETTLHRPVEVSGVGLHHGVPVNLRVTPAPPSTGLVFIRTDLDRFAIPASWRHVARVSYATSLMRQGVLISTTEHLLSTFYSLGIDNAYIEIDNLEVPILDGSGQPFVELVLQAGIRDHRRQRRYLRINRPVSIEDHGKRITILPAETFRLTCDIDFPHPMIDKQAIELEVTPERYASQIAANKTLGLFGSMVRSTAPERSLRNRTLVHVVPPSLERKTPRSAFAPYGWPSAETYTMSGLVG